MRRVRLPNTGLELSALGFGCVSLTVHRNRASALKILQLAFESGITHFDTARAYGFGESEAILGNFVRTKRSQVTITTKFGRNPPAGSSNPGLVRLARNVVRRVPGLERFLKRRLAAAPHSGAVFSASVAARSLETSLRALQTDYIDILMIHEGQHSDAANEDLLGFLESQISRGTIRYAGIGSDFRLIGADLSLFPATYTVFQFANGVTEPNLDSLHTIDRRAVLTHSALKRLKDVHNRAARLPGLLQEYSARTGEDLANPKTLARLGLQYALAANQHGIVLFATTDPEHLATDVRAALESSEDMNQLECFAKFVAAVLRTDSLNAISRPLHDPGS